jgi:hypothetical protein
MPGGNSMRSFRCIGSVLAITLALTAATPLLERAAYAQASTASGALQGTVSDPTGAILPGAVVTVTNLGTTSAKTFTADSAGFYSSGSLAPGQYKVSVSASGFAKTEKTVTVQIGTATNGDIRLAVGAVGTVVEVSGSLLQVNTTQSTVSGVLTSEQIDSLPINGRNFLDLAQLEPGVQLQSGETFDPTKAGYSSISINGVNGRTARILLDGQDISDETVGTTTLNVSSGSIEEFEISRSSLDISNELTSSGSVTVATRSGTNKVHGQVFGLFRDQRSGAAADPGGNNFPFQRNQFGGRLGGALIPDKLFAFGSFERIKQDSFNSVQVLAPFNALNGGYDSPFRDNYSAGRVDYAGPKGIHLFFRGAYENNLDDATFGFGYSRYGNKDNTPAFAGGADVLTGKLSNSFRLSYLKFHNQIADETASGVPNLAPGVFLDNNGLITGPNELAPQQTYQSDKQFRYDGGYTLKSHLFNFGASVNRILGGGFASFFGLAPEVGANFNAGPIGVGGSGMPSDPTAYPTSLFVIGNGEGFNTEKSEFGFPAGGQGDYRLGIYFGDTWKVNAKLTVNYGLRYSRDTGRSDSDLPSIPCSAVNSSFGIYNPCTDSTDSPLKTSVGASQNLLDNIAPGLSLGGRIRQPNEDYGPKAGFAYDPFGNGKTVIRGGAGLYYENNIFNNVLFDRPTRLPTGLFFNDAGFGPTSSIPLPNGTIVTSVNGPAGVMSVASLFTDAISVSAPYFAALQAQYQAATVAAGPAANINFVGNSLSEGANNGDSMYVPNFQTPRSIQFNIGIQRELWKGGIFTADYVRNVGEHFYESLDENHVGDARYLNSMAAKNAIAATLTQCNVTTVDLAIAGCPGLHTDPVTKQVTGATITDFAANGLDSGNAVLGESVPVTSQGINPNMGAAFPGINPLFGNMRFNLPLGRSTYNGLQTNYRQSTRLPIPGVKSSNLEVSYTLSRFISSGGADQNFTPAVIDNNDPLGFSGPSGTDRTHQLSFGGDLGWLGGIKTDFIGHYYSALPTSLTLDDNGGSVNSTAEIFSSDITGDGSVGDLLPGTKAGAFMRSIKPSDLSRVIANYNTTAANQITPAGQALVNANLLTVEELHALGATTRSIAQVAPANVGNGALRTFDLTLSRPIKHDMFGESFSITPSLSFFNLFNFSNFGNVTGNLAPTEVPGSANGTTSDLTGRGALRVGNGSGVFSQGAARILEYGLKIDF